MPDQMLYVPCGTRRASICPACAETYRRDAYQIVKAGLDGGKGIPADVAAHPAIFATFTAPSFGPVHTRATGPGGKVLRCRPRRKKILCPHGRHLSCPRRHKDTDACLGKPLCPDCYDYDAAVAWNAHAPELWRRTMIALRRRLDRSARPDRIKLSYAKVAEFQARGVIHFHALFRLDGYDPAEPDTLLPPPPHLATANLADAIRYAAAATWFATVPHPANPAGWDINWGPQLDIRPVSITADGDISSGKIAGYLAKYATKAAEPAGLTAVRITADTISHYAAAPTHQGRLIRACWKLGADTHPDLQGPAPLGAHARLSRPLSDQVPPLLSHLQNPPRRTRHLAATPRTTYPTRRQRCRAPAADLAHLRRDRLAHHRRRVPRPFGRRTRP